MTVDDPLARASLAELAAGLRRRTFSPVDLVELYLARIARLDGHLRAYITVCAGAARESARRAEHELGAGAARGPLHGLPFAVKDQLWTRGLRTTAGSRILEAFVPEATATSVERLLDAGAILLGKLNMSEFALGGTVRFPFGQPRNPWSPEHQPGGSSGGSAVAAAAGLAAFTLGEDTGGSIRNPASWCGIVGLRPTWGRVSRHGCLPASWSMDAVGPMTRTVADAAVVLGAIAGHDPRDPTTARRPVPEYGAALAGPVAGLRVGLVRELMSPEVTEEETRAAVLEAARVLGTLGVAVEEVSLPAVPLAGPVFMAICDSEATARQQAWLRTRPGDYDRGSRRRLLTASLLPAALYHQATRGRALIRQQVLEALGQVDALLGPGMYGPAPPIAQEEEAVSSKEGAARRFFGHRFHSTPAALAGTPALAVPCGMSRAGLPIGLQLLGRPFAEGTLLALAHAYEQASGWYRRRPPAAL